MTQKKTRQLIGWFIEHDAVIWLVNLIEDNTVTWLVDFITYDVATLLVNFIEDNTVTWLVDFITYDVATCLVDFIEDDTARLLHVAGVAGWGTFSDCQQVARTEEAQYSQDFLGFFANHKRRIFIWIWRSLGWNYSTVGHK